MVCSRATDRLSPDCNFFAQELKEADIALAPLDHSGDANPVDAIWGVKRPAPPQGPVRVHPQKFAGETVNSKLEKVSE